MDTQAVFLDIGTLVDNNDFHVTAWERAFLESLHPVDRSAIRSQIARGFGTLLPTLAPELNVSERRRIADLHSHIFQTGYLRQVRPYPRARDLIAALHSRGAQILLTSSAERAEVDHYIQLLAVRDLINDATSVDDVETTKPAGDIFGVALSRVAPIDPSEIVAVAGTPYDVVAAGRARIASVAVRTGGFGDSALLESGALAIYDSVADLLECLEGSPLVSIHDNSGT
jgi:phosphoglycolate phosphatase-like HAD superfamily hydrolase